MGSALTPTEAAFDEFAGRLFEGEDVVKVGMGISQDFKRLAWSYLHLSSLHSMNAVLDVQTLAKFAYSDVPKSDLEGLSKLAVRQLGLAVSKDEQTSDWGNRPLSNFQIQYAAIDALVQIRIVDSIFSHSVLAVQDIPTVVSSLCRRYKVHYKANVRDNAEKSLDVSNSNSASVHDDRYGDNNNNVDDNEKAEEIVDLVSLRALTMKDSGMPKTWKINR